MATLNRLSHIDEKSLHGSRIDLDDQIPAVWDKSPNIEDDLLLPVAVASIEYASSSETTGTTKEAGGYGQNLLVAESGGGYNEKLLKADRLRKFRASVAMVRTCWRLRWNLQEHSGDSPLSRLRTCVYLTVAVSRLKFTLPKLRAKREEGRQFLFKLQPARKWVAKPMLRVFRSTAYGVLFATILSTKVNRNHAECAPLNVAMNLLSAASKVKLDDSLNFGKCTALLQIFFVLGTYLSIFRFILLNIPTQTTRIEGLSACYYILEEICRLLRQCTQYIRDCSGNSPSRRVYAKLESLSTIEKLILDLDRCLQLLSIKVDDFVDKNSFPKHFGSKPTGLRLSGQYLDCYLQLQAEKDQSDLLLKLRQSTKHFWLGYKTWKNKSESQLLIERLEYDKKSGREIDYLKHGLCVDPKNVRVMRVLGTGSYGEVHEVMCFGERYAMKTIVSDLDNPNEAIIQAGLQHPNIVKLIWYTTNVDPRNKNSTLSLLMEFMDIGLDVYLDQRNHNRKPPLAKNQLGALHILLQIANAMTYLHSQEIMHRDLKAANVLVDLSWSPDFKAGYLHVKVCDFGFSKLKQAGAKKSLNTAKVGTGYWRAPEVLILESLSMFTDEEAEAVDLAKYSFSADVYSYAMTCYEILSGKEPFANHRRTGLKERIATMNERPSLPEDDLHPGLVDLIKRCWDGNRKARPSFKVICEELESIKEELLFGR